MVRLIEEDYGTYNNEPVKKFTWTTDSGFSLTAISFGAVVQNILVPDKNGYIADVALAFDDVKSYATRNSDTLGCVVGRCANRIAKGVFYIDGTRHEVTRNWHGHHLHGGLKGFGMVNWQTTVDGTKVIFSRLSVDGEEGYPGDLMTNITYEVRDDDTWCIEYTATTTKKTVVNMTNHSYFNLAGHAAGAEELYKHVIQINADKVLEGDSDFIPSGKLLPVAGTPFDFRTPVVLGDVIGLAKDIFHHNLCVTTHGKKGMSFVAHVSHPPSGRFIEVYSDQPGLNFYTGNYLPDKSQPALLGKGGVGYRRHGGLCLETQKYIDAINHPHFPSVLLIPGEVYKQRVEYKFGAVQE